MKCPKCGTEITEEESVCEKCKGKNNIIGNVLCIIALVLAGLSLCLGYFDLITNDYIYGATLILSIVLLVSGFGIAPNSIMVKIIALILFIYVIIITIITVFGLIGCVTSPVSCDGTTFTLCG